MNITWVLADELILDPATNINRMKSSGAFWGSWKTWRAYGTDNVICHDARKAEELVKRTFQNSCNLYIPNSVYQMIGRPARVKLYEGDFMGHDVDHQDELVSMYLAGTQADVILLIGFDWSAKPEETDKLQEVRARNYRGLALQAIKSRPDVQWILVDHPAELHSVFANLPNLGTDTLDNVFQILNG